MKFNDDYLFLVLTVLLLSAIVALIIMQGIADAIADQWGVL